MATSLDSQQKSIAGAAYNGPLSTHIQIPLHQQYEGCRRGRRPRIYHSHSTQEDQMLKYLPRQRATRFRQADTLTSILLDALNLLRRKDKYAIFHEPVDQRSVPAYRDVISNPMDFFTMEKKIKEQAYSGFDDFNFDVELIFQNCQLFNPPATIFYKQAISMCQWWRKIRRDFYTRVDALPPPEAVSPLSTQNILQQQQSERIIPTHEQLFTGASIQIPPQEPPKRRLPSLRCKQHSSAKSSTLGEILQSQGTRGVIEKVLSSGGGAVCRWDTFTFILRLLRLREASDLVSLQYFDQSQHATKRRRLSFENNQTSLESVPRSKFTPDYSRFMECVDNFLKNNRQLAIHLPCIQSLFQKINLNQRIQTSPLLSFNNFQSVTK